MFRRKSRKRELIRFKFDMPEEAYNHWLLGRQGRPVNDVVREAIGQTREDPKAIRKRCEGIVGGSKPDGRSQASGRGMQITLELPAEESEAAVRSVGRIGNENEPVKSGRLLAAMILESPSWRQKGDSKGEFAAGWHTDGLEASVQSLTISPGTVTLAEEELRLAKIGAGAAVVIAVFTVLAAGAAIASAVADWCGLQSSEHTVGPDAATMESVVMGSALMSNEDIYEAHRERLNELRIRGREYAETLREVARVLGVGEGRPEDDQLLMPVPSCDAPWHVHTQIRAARGQLRRAVP